MFVPVILMQKKYFIAIVPPENVLLKIEAVKENLFREFGLKGALRSPAHITLHRPFEWKAEKEEELISALKEFRFNEQFLIELKNYNCFQPRVIYIDVVKNDALNNLHSELKKYARHNLQLFNEDNDLRGFHPHVTVAFRDLKKQLFYKLWEERFKAARFEGHFDFTGFSLLRLEKKWEVIAGL